MASTQSPAAADNVDPVYEWLDDGASYLLRLDLPGFKTEDFRVHVDGEGRLTVIGHRKPTPGSDGKALRLHKTFQLPNTANLDTIKGRFDSNVLTLTVPKLPAGAAAPTPPPPPPQAKAEARVAGDKKPAADQEDKAAKVGQERTEVERTSLTARSKEEDVKKAKATAPPPSEKARGDHEQQDHQDGKARADHREKVAREAARRVEAARARVAEAKAKAERERKCEHWKDRAMEEGMKLAEAVNKNKEVIATAVAAFTLGVFVSTRLFSKN
ncbi:protein RESTRICTED TEV MOVEMENT 2-like [Miscanthus floridulus]|uniref:protein RESTRICTED TEV MOVEMENT 2-like n=1 Tax=Miscanthus floridulus TaxID=154761 RepID=UPI00345AF90E